MAPANAAGDRISGCGDHTYRSDIGGSMKRKCGCPDAKGCFHVHCSPGRVLPLGQVQIIKNPVGYIRLVDPKELVNHPDGTVSVKV